MSNIVEVAEGAHSDLGPSAADRWLECPGSVLATKDVEDIPSQYAIEGTAAHTVSEWVRLQNVPAKAFLGTTVRVTRGSKHWDVLCDESMVDSVQTFVDKVAEQPGEELVEARVQYEEYVPCGFGTLDSGKLLDLLCRVTDFKHGEGVKKWAKMNPQLMLYALGIYFDYGWAYQFKTFILAICQPRLDHYDEWEISLFDLLTWANDVAKPGALLALTPGAPFKAGEWCQFCRIRATCVERARTVFEAVTGDFTDLDSPEKLDGIDAAVPLLTNDRIAKALTAWKHIAKWGAALKAYALAEIAAGRAVGDMKLVAGRSDREWTVPAADVVESLAHGKIVADDLYTKRELLSVAKVEKIVGKVAIEGLFKKVAGAPTLVPGSDPRPPTEQAALADFNSLPEE